VIEGLLEVCIAMIRLSSKSIDINWKLIERVLKDCLPPKEHMGIEALFTIRAALMDGDMQCWVQRRDKTVVSVTITTVFMDKYSGARALLIYACFTFLSPTEKEQGELVVGLQEFQRSRGCYNVVALRKEI